MAERAGAGPSARSSWLGLASAGARRRRRQPAVGRAGRRAPARRPALAARSAATTRPTVPLAAALALVLLACWGVLLVTRGRVRRVVACSALLAARRHAGDGRRSALRSATDGLRDDLAEARRRPTSTTAAPAWFWVGRRRVPSLAVAAARWPCAWCRRWPEMGSRYDAPERPPPTPRDGRPASTCGRPSTRAATRPCRSSGLATPRLSPARHRRRTQEPACRPPRQHPAAWTAVSVAMLGLRRRRRRPDARPGQHAAVLGRLRARRRVRSSCSP